VDSHATHPSLLLRLKDHGDDAAWREFEARYRDLVFRYGRRRGLQLSDAEDVMQDVLVSLASALRTFEYRPERGRFHAYLGRVVDRAVHRHRHRLHGEPVPVDAEALARLHADGESPLDELWEQEWIAHHYRMAFAAVRGAIEPRSVQVFERLLAGEAIGEVARGLGMTSDAVHKVKQRVRARMEELVAAQIREEDGEDAA
jgi:RNA polymerase sigma factor (sigma-70 family)